MNIKDELMIDNNSLENLTILYAEDEPTIQEGVRETLKLFKINVVCAKNGMEALELYKEQEQNIDMILTDIKMPKLDGLSLIKQIRKNDKFIPVVITTAHQETNFLKSSIEFGISAYVLKPIDIYQLRDTLIKAIEPKILKDRLIGKNKKLQIEIKKNKEKSELMISQSRFASMGEMINMIAHQWRQPLASIGTASFNLKYKIQTKKYDLSTKEGQEEQASFFTNKLNEIEHYVQNLTTTIDDFRNFYKTDKKLVNTNINEPINGALKIILKSLKTNNIAVNLQLKSTKKINIYENEVMHVILNILKNSQDNFLENTKELMKIDISTTDLEHQVEILVSDSGGGIGKEIIDKIFEPYFSTKKEKNGTGIGLYMSKIIVEKHHKGTIKATNIDNGVTFKITIPNNLLIDNLC
jgi:signal transduction histidine kinase